MSSVYSLSSGSGGGITGSGASTQLAVWDSASSVTGYSTLTYASSVLIAPAHATNTANVASTGAFRLANTEGVYFRNAANSADISLVLNSSDTLFLNGTTMAVENSTAGSTVGVRVVSNDNTSGTSNARFYALSGGASGGDAFFRASIASATDWSFGCDNSDGDSFVLCQAATLSTTNLLRIAKSWTSSDNYRMYWTNVAPNTSGTYIANYFDTSLSNGSTPSGCYGLVQGMTGNYTGTGQIFGIVSTVTVTGTGSNPSLAQFNTAYSASCTGTTTGFNIGYRSRIQNGDVSMGAFLTTETMKNNAKYFGVVGLSKNTNSGAIGVAGYFASAVETDISSSSDLTSTHATVVIDNKAVAIPALAVQDNGTNKFVILDGGAIGVAGSAAATTPGSVVKKLEIFDTSGVSLGFLPIYSSIT